MKKMHRHDHKNTADSKSDAKEGEIIMSNRRNNQNISPSPSPDKYDIEPTRMKTRTFEIGPKPTKKTNYYSATNKKAKK